MPPLMTSITSLDIITSYCYSSLIMNTSGNTFRALSKERDQIDINERRQHIWPHLSRFEKFGAFAMTTVGRAVDLLNANDGLEDHLSSLRRNAYKNSRHAHVARRIWGGLAAITMVGSIAAAYTGTEIVDNHFACSGEQNMQLYSGSDLTDLARQIPHKNTPITRVINMIADNPDNNRLIGTNYVTDSPNPDDVIPGIYVVPKECDSNL